MTPRPPSWQAPVVFRTHRGGARWAEERNPFRPGSQAFYEWQQLYWRDQADRGFARAERTARLAIVCASIAVVLAVLRLIS